MFEGPIGSESRAFGRVPDYSSYGEGGRASKVDDDDADLEADPKDDTEEVLGDVYISEAEGEDGGRIHASMNHKEDRRGSHKSQGKLGTQTAKKHGIRPLPVVYYQARVNRENKLSLAFRDRNRSPRDVQDLTEVFSVRLRFLIDTARYREAREVVSNVRRALHRDLLASLEEGMPAHTQLKLMDVSKTRRLIAVFTLICQRFGFSFDFDDPQRLVKEDEKKTEIHAYKKDQEGVDTSVGKVSLYRKFRKTTLAKELEKLEVGMCEARATMDLPDDYSRQSAFRKLQRLRTRKNQLEQNGNNRMAQRNLAIIVNAPDSEYGKSFIKLFGQASFISESLSDKGAIFEKVEALYNYYGEYDIKARFPDAHKIIWPIFNGSEAHRGKKIVAAINANLADCMDFLLQLDLLYKKI